MKTDDETLFIEKLDDAVNAVLDRFCPVYTAFVDPYLSTVAIDELKKHKDVRFRLFGGYEESERNIVCVFSEYDDEDNLEFPIKTLKITGRDISRLSHRDYLGTLMSLGIKREKIGDIVVTDECTYIFVASNIYEYICLNMTKVGGCGIKIEVLDTSEIIMPEREFEEKTGTVSSLRLDAVASLAFGLSRAKCLTQILQGKVFVNHKICENASKEVCQGDLITLRGSGRVILDNVGSLSRKGRIFITLKRYI